MDKEIRVAITPSTIISAVLILMGAYVFWLLRDLALLVLTAIVMASAIEPEIAFFIRHGMPRFFAAILVYVLIFGSVFGLLFFFFPPIISDAAGFLSSLPQYLDALKASGSFQDLSNASSAIGGSHDLQSFAQTLLSLQSMFTTGAGSVVQVFVTFFGGIFSFLMVIVLSFYFALQDTGVDDFLRLVMPASYEDYSVDLWKRAQKKIGLWMQGQILLSIVVAVLVYLGLLIIGVPYALLLSVFTAFAEIVPIFGSLIAGLLAVIVAYSNGGLAIGAVVLGLYIVVNQFESNLIYPLIVKKVVGVPPLMVIVALVAGYTLAGFLGVLLSVPIAAVVLELITDFDKRKRRIASSRA
jgi:predicted PurR-regulated permease PerM